MENSRLFSNITSSVAYYSGMYFIMEQFMDILLQVANIAIRSNRPLDPPEQAITVFRQGRFLQLTFQTQGCRFSAGGSCSMCNYGCGSQPDANRLMNELSKVLDTCGNCVETILLGASGSFLDEKEIPESLRNRIFQAIFQSGIPQIIIETHYKSISGNVLRRVSRLLPSRRIELEVGLETVNPWIGEHILNKHINLPEFERMIAAAHHYGMTVTVNLLLGIPFFTEAAQLSDTKVSIQWALSKKADYIVVFPLNIHPYTLFEWLYQKGLIQPPSLWLAVRLLSELDDFALAHVSMAWYGNRSIDYGEGRVSILPQVCGACREALLSFFETFYISRNLDARKRQIADLLQVPLSCDCRERAFRKVPALPGFLESKYQAARYEIKELVEKYECL